MRCPFCGIQGARVMDSRPVQGEEVIRRRRECCSCKRRFTTYERVDLGPIMVIKKDGRREEFQRDKMLNGLRKACEKREVGTTILEKMVDELLQQIWQSGQREISSTGLGEMVVERLRGLDPVAYVRFASVYREFKDVSSFLAELEELERE